MRRREARVAATARHAAAGGYDVVLQRLFANDMVFNSRSKRH